MPRSASVLVLVMTLACAPKTSDDGVDTDASIDTDRVGETDETDPVETDTGLGPDTDPAPDTDPVDTDVRPGFSICDWLDQNPPDPTGTDPWYLFTCLSSSACSGVIRETTEARVAEAFALHATLGTDHCSRVHTTCTDRWGQGTEGLLCTP